MKIQIKKKTERVICKKIYHPFNQTIFLFFFHYSFFTFSLCLSQFCLLFRLQQMKNSEKVLHLHPHLSKLIDSLCLQLAVNLPDQNSLSLLEMISMKKQQQISYEEFKELYKSWLQSKNISDIFTSKQIKSYPKIELITDSSLSEHLHFDTINSSLELLHDVYQDLYRANNQKNLQLKRIKQIEDLFSYLDSDGNIHVRLSHLFFLFLALRINQNTAIPINYNDIKNTFRMANKEMCEVDGIVSLRWFKNYFITKKNLETFKGIMGILLQIDKNIRMQQTRNHKGHIEGLPNILQEAFHRWRYTTNRFSGLFESKKKKLDIYQRIFEENQYIFFYNCTSTHLNLCQGFFAEKYGQQFIRSLELDNNLLRQFNSIFQQILNQYLFVVAKMQGGTSKISKSNISALYETPAHSNITSSAHARMGSNAFNTNRKYAGTGNNQNSKPLGHDFKLKQKTPAKVNKGNETRRFNVTPTNKNMSISPYVQRQFGSTEKSLTKNKSSMTPTKSSSGHYYSSLFSNQTPQLHVFKNAKKTGLEKGSFYQKLFFFRNKRVQSFDIVMKRLKGK